VSEISSALSDANGRYSLELTVFGACNEDLYEMSAGRDGFRTVRYTRSRGEPFLRCQAGVQTIDFSLERLP